MLHFVTRGIFWSFGLLVFFDGYYEITGKTDVIVLAVVGDTARLLAQISRNSSLVSCTDEHYHSLLYLTARAGFYDTTEAPASSKRHSHKHRKGRQKTQPST